MIVVASVTLCLTLAIGRSPHLLAQLAVLAGLAQCTLITFTHSSSVQYLDDIAVASLIAFAVGVAATSAGAPEHRALIFILALVTLSGFALVRTPDLQVGVAQLRQVLLPIGLLFSGFVLRDRLRWGPVFATALLAALVTAGWVLVEEGLRQPLIDPLYYYLDVIRAPADSLRWLPGYGLVAPSYAADVGGGAAPIFRPGGPYMNPPTAGFVLGLGAFVTIIKIPRGFLRTAVLVLLGAALAASYARAGMLIFVSATALFWLWQRAGRWMAIVAGLASGAYVASLFLTQGNTAAHSDGLVSGFMVGSRSLLGIGFGTTGYQSNLEGGVPGAGGESLMGLYFAWLGVSAVIAAAWLVLILWKRLRSAARSQALPILVSVGFMATVALSESSSAMAATPVLWLILGSALSSSVPAAQLETGAIGEGARGHEQRNSRSRSGRAPTVAPSV